MGHLAPAGKRLLRGLGLLVLAPLVGSCGRDRPIPARSPAGRSWLALRGRPEPQGAIGFLDSGESPRAGSCVVTWAGSGRRGKVDAADLLRAPFAPALEEGGERAAPAVFALEGDLALVFGKRGWGWAMVQPPWRFASYEGCLDDLIRRASMAQGLHPLRDGWCLHDGWVLTFTAQPLKAAPSESAPASPWALPDHYAYAEAEWIRPQAGRLLGEEPEPGVDQLRVKAERRAAGNLARALQRQGDWVQVMLPRVDRRIYSTVADAEGRPGLIVTWNPEAVGWVRWRSSGALPDTTRISFGATYWGYRE